MILGQQAGRHLFLIAICTNCWKIDCCYFGGKEFEENGRWWFVRYVLYILFNFCLIKSVAILLDWGSIQELCFILRIKTFD